MRSSAFFRLLFLVSFFEFFVCSLCAQDIERKIIIKNGLFYYATTDDELQLASLHIGSLAEPLKQTKKFVLPAGRNFNDPIIPFCWDLSDRNIFAINFITNAMNSRSKALKFFTLSSLTEWSNDTETMANQLEMSFEQHVFTGFEPYHYITEQSSILEYFFFDMIALSDSSICVAIANKGSLSIWMYANNKWTHSEMIKLAIDESFSLFTHKGDIYLFLADGKIVAASTKAIRELPQKKSTIPLRDAVLIIDKDEDRVKILERKHLQMPLPFRELVQKNAIPVF
jgi:hypothetical protein